MDPKRPGFMGAFIVETEWDGVKIGKDVPKMGLKASSTAAIQFKSVKVPRKSGRNISPDLDVLAYFLEEARQARRLNRRLFSVRPEQLHHRIASEIVSGRKRAKGYSDELVGGMQGAEVSHETTWNPIALSPITV